MPTLVAARRGAAPASLGETTRRTSPCNAIRATTVPGYPPGAFAQLDARQRQLRQYGVKVLGTLGDRGGHPHATALPSPSHRRTRSPGLADRYDVYGDYGFPDAVDSTDRRPPSRSTGR